MLARVWSSLWKVKIAAEGRPDSHGQFFLVTKRCLLAGVMGLRELTGINVDINLVLTGGEQNSLVTRKEC
jgi:hypothetical protein